MTYNENRRLAEITKVSAEFREISEHLYALKKDGKTIAEFCRLSDGIKAFRMYDGTELDSILRHKADKSHIFEEFNILNELDR